MYIARQPIFNKQRNIYGYELLFRSTKQSKGYDGTSSKASTASVLSGLFEWGMDNIAGDSKAFVNFDSEMLKSSSLELIRPERLVVEILETVKIDEAVSARVIELKEKGYKIALDDYQIMNHSAKVEKDVDIIKYDILATPLNEIESQVKAHLKQHKILLAEKVETEKEFLLAKKLGFHLFQGYFFQKPQMIAGMAIKKTPKIIYQMLLVEMKKDEASFTKLAEIISNDINIAYRIMRIDHITSKKERLKTVRTAIVRMGLNELEHWVYLLMIQDFSSNKPLELLRLSLIRSKFGELLAKNSSFIDRQHEISLMCLFSILDALLDTDMETALENVSISDDIKDALIGKKGNLASFIKMIQAYEKADWPQVDKLSRELNMLTNYMATSYLESIWWADQTVRNF
ncbi:EAL and HDOD domain-containing protein [Lacticigenium naphthae]|uniref:EAL and HDOD domain-containing protein n=1 Tax=Lacticigenium naphthae TaxID=515351 RepID=UPI0004036392|nr:EAL domain-containing protein [Lacticigenium naphthae]